MPPSALVGPRNAVAPEDEAGGGEVRPGDVLHQLSHRGLGVVHQVERAVDDFPHVVRRDVGGHPHGDARAPVDQEVGESSGENQRLLGGVVEVRPEVDGLLVDVGEHGFGQLGHPALGVPVGGGRVSVDAAEVPLPVDEQVAHVPRLGQTHQGVVDGGVAVGVVLLEHLADHAGALAVLAVVEQPLVLHRVEDAAMHGLQSVAHVGERPTDDDGHRVVEVAPAHLVLDVDRDEVAGAATGRTGRCRGGRKVVGHGWLEGARAGVLQRGLTSI